MIDFFIDQPKEFRVPFIKSYRVFVKPKNLLLIFIQRFNNTQIKKIQLKILTALNTFIEDYLYNATIFAFEPILDEIPKICLGFIDQLTKDKSFDIKFKSLYCKMNILKTLQYSDKIQKQYTFSTFIFKDGISCLTDFSVKELAKQFTIMEYENFCKIKPYELFNVCWRKNPNKSPNVLSLLTKFDLFSRWICNTILKEEKVENRCIKLSYFLQLGKELFLLRNFQTLFALIAGLTCSPIFRIKKSFQLLTKDEMNTFEDFRELVSLRDNFSICRSHLKDSLEKPSIPYMGMLLSDLKITYDIISTNEMIQEKISSEREKYIHWYSITEEYKIINLIESWQFDYFPLKTNGWKKNLFCEELCKIEFDIKEDWKQLYNISLNLEPRT